LTLERTIWCQAVRFRRARCADSRSAAARTQASRAQLQVEDLVMDRLSHSVHRCGHAIDLSPKEFGLLEFLMRNAGIRSAVRRLWNKSGG